MPAATGHQNGGSVCLIRTASVMVYLNNIAIFITVFRIPVGVIAMREDLRNQLQQSLSNSGFVFSCCGLKFDTLYEFRQHVYQHHRDIYDGVFAGFHREVTVPTVPPRCPQRKRPGYKRKSKGSKTTLSPYKTNRPPISIPMGGAVKK